MLRIFIFLISTIFLTCALAKPSQPPQPWPAPLKWPTNMILPSGAPFGTLPGAGSVTATGEYRYELPIEVPPGRLGMQPALSLVYTSNAGNGLLGVGWTLDGISAIKRCPKTFATDGAAIGIQLNDTDVFCWNGRKLVAITPAVKTGTQEYRTEEDVFAKIVATVQNGRIMYFRVWTKEGRILDFSKTFGGVILYDFLLTDEADRSGNGVNYSYNIVSESEYYPETSN
jgi:Salmonella virulence plasmid 65kDa B protein